jgi:SNF2 family DNA or RNA helicase
MRVGGQGITLTAAAHVVFAQLDWSPAMIEQYHDRCHRITQERPVKVVCFVLDDSLDGVMMTAIGRKVSTSRAALNRHQTEEK